MEKLNLKKVYDIENPPFKKCPYCDNDIFYRKESCYGKYDCYFSYINNDVENGDMIDNLVYKDIGKFIYCADCDKRLFKYRD